jgi:hypothetical protein
VIVASPSLTSIVTTSPERDFTMSPVSLGSTAAPSARTSTGTDVSTVSSRSEPTSWMAPSVVRTRRPDNTGRATDREVTARTAVPIASTRASRWHRNFTRRLLPWFCMKKKNSRHS